MIDILVSRGSAVRQFICYAMLVCSMAQALTRYALDYLVDQHFAAVAFGWVAMATTLIKWLCMLCVDRYTGFAIFDADDASMLVLGIITIFFQGLIAIPANAYWAQKSALQFSFIMTVVSWITHQHVPRDNKPLLLTPNEFTGLFLLIAVVIYVFGVTQMQCACQTPSSPNHSNVHDTHLLVPLIHISPFTSRSAARVESTSHRLQASQSNWLSSATAFPLRWPSRRSEQGVPVLMRLGSDAPSRAVNRSLSAVPIVSRAIQRRQHWHPIHSL